MKRCKNVALGITLPNDVVFSMGLLQLAKRWMHAAAKLHPTLCVPPDLRLRGEK